MSSQSAAYRGSWMEGAEACGRAGEGVAWRWLKQVEDALARRHDLYIEQVVDLDHAAVEVAVRRADWERRGLVVGDVTWRERPGALTAAAKDRPTPNWPADA